MRNFKSILTVFLLAAYTATANTLSIPGEPVGQFGSDIYTFTNKTLDVEGTGNSVTIPEKHYFKTAQCNDATPTLLMDSPTANAGAATCITGTNTQKGVAAFDQTTSESLQTSMLLPADWSGAIDVRYEWMTAGTTSPVVWCTQVVCVANTETGDPAFPAQAAANCVSDASHGTTLQLNVASDTGITATTCAAGELMHLRFSRDPAEVSTLTDTLAGDAWLIGVELTLRRAM